MINAVDQFKARVLKLEIGEPYVYFRGHLASNRAHMQDLDIVGALAYGLHLLGLVALHQKRIIVDDDLGHKIDGGCSYVLRVLGPIRNADFDKGHTAYVKSIRVKEAA